MSFHTGSKTCIQVTPHLLVSGIPPNKKDCVWWFLHEVTRENEELILTTRKKKKAVHAECCLALCYSVLRLVLTLNGNSNHSHLQIFYCQRNIRNAVNLSNLSSRPTNLFFFFFLTDVFLYPILGPFWPIRNLPKSVFCPLLTGGA